MRIEAIAIDGTTRLPLNGLAGAREYLRAHVADPVSLCQLARIAGLSKYYFLRTFSRAYGVTPHEYQMQLRLEHARQLIAEGRALSYVAYDAGFADQSHLTRRFKQSYGVTPGAYRRRGAADEHVAA